MVSFTVVRLDVVCRRTPAIDVHTYQPVQQISSPRMVMYVACEHDVNTEEGYMEVLEILQNTYNIDYSDIDTMDMTVEDEYDGPTNEDVMQILTTFYGDHGDKIGSLF